MATSLIPSIPSIGARIGNTSSRYKLTPEDEESLARRAGRGVLGGIAAVGNLLDVPGSMVRDVLGGENPLDQLLHPMSPQNRLTGRDLMRKSGMIGRKDTWGNFAGGLAAEIALDPLTYIFPAGALSKGGKLVKKAGLMGEVEHIASKAHNIPIEQMGKRQAALKTTFKDVFDFASPAQKKAIETAAEKSGVRINDVMDDSLRGMFGLGVLGKPMAVYGTKAGGKAEKYAKGLDVVGRSIRQSPIIATPMRLLNSKLGGVPGEGPQKFMRKGFEAKEVARASGGLDVVPFLKQLREAGWHDEGKGDLLRSYFETLETTPAWHNVPPEIQGIVQDIHKFTDQSYDEVIRAGGRVDKYESPFSQYFPRRGVTEDALPSGAASSKATSVYNASSNKRVDIFRPFTDDAGVVHAIPDETNTINKLIKDEEIGDMISQYRPVDEIADKIKQKYPEIPEQFLETEGITQGIQNRHKALAEYIANLPETTRKTGLFINHPVADLHTFAVGARVQRAGLANIKEMVASPGVLHPPGTAARQAGYTTLGKALNDAAGKVDPDRMAVLIMQQKHGANYSAVIDDLAQRLGKPVADLTPEEVTRYFRNHRISDEYAEAIKRTALGFEAPKAAREFMKAYDSVLSLWKGMQTSLWPGFWARNRFSGMVNNWMSGMWSPAAEIEGWKLVAGKAVKDAHLIPEIKEMARLRGITNLTEEQATDLLSELAWANGLTSKYSGEHMARAGAGLPEHAQTFGDIASEIPQVGRTMFSAKRAAKKWIGREPGTSLKPHEVRGFGGRQRTSFGPMAAGEEVSAAVEDLNRLVPFIHQLKKGVHSSEATKSIGLAQVRYESRFYSPLERDYLKRIFPFWSFSSRMPIWVAKELVERPSGRLGQTIRLLNRARNPSSMTPDYVAETTSIPLGTDKEGFDKYLTGAGLMFEDPVSFLGSGVRGAGLETLSRTSPLIKAPLEWATGQSFFQKGPQGGRDLGDLDPTIGRTLANLTGRKDAVRWPGSKPMEHVLGNVIGRPLTSARTATYPLRKPSAGEFAKTAANLLTGFRVTSVSPGAKDAMLRERAQQMMKDMGGKTFVKTYIPEEVEGKMTPQELQDGEKLEALMHLLSMRAKERKLAETPQ